MVATTDKLGLLHNKLADVLTEYMDEMDTTDALNTQSNVQVMKLVSSFLKENNITADLGDGNDEDEVQKKLKELHAKRRVAQTPLDAMN